MSATTFYPAVSSIISLDDLPEQLQFLEAGISSIFDKVYFRDLQFTRSRKGDAAFYSLILILDREVGFTIPGVDISFLLNPDYGATGITEIPITIEYEWKILAVLKQIQRFKAENFSFSPQAFFDVVTDILGISGENLMAAAVGQFTTEADPIDAIKAFVDDVNAEYSSAVPYPTSTDPGEALVEVLDSLDSVLSKNPFEVVFKVYIEDITSIDLSLDNLNQLFIDRFGEPPVDYIKTLLIPKFHATLSFGNPYGGIGMVFPRKYLTPLDPGNNYQPFPENVTNPVRSMLKFGVGDVLFSTESGIGFKSNLTASLNYVSEIGKTGLRIDLKNAKLDVSRTTNIPEATADGRPLEFVGAYIEKAEITLPPKWFKDQGGNTATIFGRNMIIGTGGFSGRIGIEASATNPPPPNTTPSLEVRLGNNSGFRIGFYSFDLVFQQNAIVESNIKGYLYIPGFEIGGQPARIDIDINIEEDGDFKITASVEQGIPVISIKDILDVNINSLSIGREDDRFFLAVSGKLDFADQTGKPGGNFIKDNLPKDIEIQKLMVWEDGKIEFEGGGIQLRKPLSLKLKPVELTITALHFGSHEQEHQGHLRQYKYFGFDGGVSVKPGGVDARGDGIKFYFTVDNDPGAGKNRHVFVRIQSIAIDIMIPGDAKPETATLLLSGYLSMKEPSNPGAAGAGTEYAGGITFSLPKLKIAGSAAMRYNPKVPAFLIDIGLEIPTPIPLGPTGLGIYGFRALVGQRYVATREAVGLSDQDKWYQYYKAKVSPDFKEGIQASKFEQKEGFSLGAGVSLATSGDSGKVFSAKIFFLLSLPEVFLLEGQGQILKERIGLDSTNDPPFYAFIAITSSSVETALGVNYKLPESGNNTGKIVKVDGLIELAFFFGNSAGWYVNLGRDLPEEKRISARILDLFNAYFYLMISSSGIRAGAGASYSLKKKFGPFGVELSAYLDIAGKINFKPKQIGGSIQMGGSVYLKIFGFKFGFSVDVGLAAEAPKPFIVTGKLKICVKVLWKKRCAKIELTWKKGTDLDSSEIELLDPDLDNAGKAINIMSREPFALRTFENATISNPNTWSDIDDFIIPVDSFIDIEFKKGVHVTGAHASLDRLGGVTHAADYSIKVAPQKGKSDQVKHEFYVDKVDIKSWNPTSNQWEDYLVYEALTAFDVPLFPDANSVNMAELKQGFWQLDNPKKYNKLRILAQTPFSYTTQGSDPPTPESLNITTGTIFCEGTRREKKCVDLRKLIRYNRIKEVFVPAYEYLYADGVIFYLRGQRSEIVDRPYQNYRDALRIGEKEELELFFNEPTSCVTLVLQTEAPSIVISYYVRRDTGQVDGNGIPIYGYVLIHTQVYQQAQLNSTIIYEDNDNPVDKVVIEAGCCQEQPELVCDTNMSEQAQQLGILLDTMARYGHHAEGMVSLYPKEFARYNNIFFNTSLYGSPVKGSEVLYTYKQPEQYRFELQFYDSLDYSCTVNLEILNPDAQFSWPLVKGFSNLRPNPNTLTNGPNYDFLIDINVTVKGGDRVYVAAGTSCYAVINCELVGAPGNSEPALPAAGIQNLLEGLTNIGKLEQPRDLNITKGTYSDDFAPLLAEALFGDQIEGQELHYESNTVEGSGLDLRFYSKEKGGFSLEMKLRPENIDIGFSYKELMGFQDVELIKPVPGSTEVTFTVTGVHKHKRKTYFTQFNGTGTLRGPSLPKMTPIAKAAVLPDPSNGELECDAPTQQSQDLEIFFNALIEFQDYPKSISRLLSNDYGGTFWGTSLYDGPSEVIIYQSQPMEEIPGLIITLSDDRGFNCTIELITSDGSGIHPYQVTRFFNLRPDPNRLEAGDNYYFLIDGEVFLPSTGQTISITMSGRSCYPIVTCRETGCATFLYRVCYLTQEDFEYNETIPTQVEVQGDNTAMIEALNKTVQPIWRPNTIFAIHVQTTDKLTVNGSNLVPPYVTNAVFGFKTAGGIGFFHKYLDGTNIVDRADYAALVANDNEDSYKLANLNHYIDYAKSYPNADGRLTNAKPLFYINPDLLLFFVKQYVFAMFSEWATYNGAPAERYDLEAIIKDPVKETDVFVVGAAWDSHDTPVITQDVNIIGNMIINGLPCSIVENVTSIGIHTEFFVPELKPLKAYTAIFNAKYEDQSNNEYSQEVHRYVFQTSRYGNFEEQIHSYRLKDEAGVVQREAIFDIEHAPANAAKAQQIILDTLPTTDALFQEYAHPYDRLMEGAFQLGAFHPAVTTEFNVIKNGSTILGILVRNPEPFNDPKIEEATMADTLKLQVNLGNANDYVVIFSKDNANAWVTNSDGSMNMPLGDYKFTFKYKQFDGHNYIDVATISDVEFTLS